MGLQLSEARGALAQVEGASARCEALEQQLLQRRDELEQHSAAAVRMERDLGAALQAAERASQACV